MIKKDYIRLKDLLNFGEFELFEKEVLELELDEIANFFRFIMDFNQGDLLKDYHGVKILGELMYVLFSRNFFGENSSSLESGESTNIGFHALASATSRAFDLGYYNDAEKYGQQLIRYPEISSKNLLTFLSTLAMCAHQKNDPKSELHYCELMLEINDQDTAILTNYSYALIKNKMYVKSISVMEHCLLLGGENFEIYNQLARATLYESRDYKKAIFYLTKIFESNFELNERRVFLLFHNTLLISALSGDKELLDNITEIKAVIQEMASGEALASWNNLINSCEKLNKAVLELNNGNYDFAQQELCDLVEFKEHFGIRRQATFLNDICKIINENSKLEKITDIKFLLDFIERLQVDELEEDYKLVIYNYFSLSYDFYLYIKENKEILGIQSKKAFLENFTRVNTSTSDFINKSFKIIKLIESYITELSTCIIQDNVKDKYLENLRQVVLTQVDINYETTFLYSLNQVHNIDDELCSLLIKSIQLLQRNEPSFIRKFKSSKGEPLLETDFRDVIYRTLGMSDEIHISAEALSRVGRTDLQIESNKFGTKTFEFKIWGSNDYKEVVRQLYEYMTDFEDVGFIFMVNKNKTGISESYKENLCKNEMGFIADSLEEMNVNGFEYYVSKHKIHVKTKTIYHFIYNIF
jgi:hypothetical protein